MLKTSDLQFGFKHKSNCTQAIFLLRQITEYFVKHGSTVYMASLDAKKAFDRVNHIKLFNILLDRGLPGNLVRVLFDWYSKTSSMVKWDNVFSAVVPIRSGVRQGGILSPFLFNIYVDVIFDVLRNSDLGCHLPGSTYVGFIAYADDIILLSASVSDLQLMLNICSVEGGKLDILFNAVKSCLFKVWKDFKSSIQPLKLGLESVEWVVRLKYLGLYFIASRHFTVDFSTSIRKSYASANAIFKQSKYVSEDVKLHLVETYVLPVLTYGIEALQISNRQCRLLGVCWNNMFRKIFHFNQWSSVKSLQCFCERLDIQRLFHLRKLCFFFIYSAHNCK